MTQAPTPSLDAPNRGPAHLIALVCAGLFITLLVIIARSPHEWAYDEQYYIVTVRDLRDLGPTLEYLRGYKYLAGPLYGVIHLAASPLTHLSAPAIRFVNPVLLVALMAVTAATMRRMHAPNPWTLAITLIAIPPIWIVTGIALTEIPAMLCVALCVLALKVAFDGFNDAPAARTLGLFALAGFCLGLAILGRTNFIVLLPMGCVPLIYYGRRAILPVLTFFLAAAILPGIVFGVWHGLVPPSMRPFTKRGFVVWHGVLAFAFAGVMVLIWAPMSIIRQHKAVWIASAIVAATNVIGGWCRWAAMISVARKVLPERLLPVYASVVGSGLLVVGLVFIAVLVSQTWRFRHDPTMLFINGGALLLLASTAGISHQFSSRYPTCAAALVLLSLHRESPDTYAKPLRILAGAALGVLTLLSYFAPAITVAP
ncbi:MAG: hypothetical protein K8S99_13805 [Planctomycetes bacterium]|nr:hypothetical protein [Planctomycetota bacterium]